MYNRRHLANSVCFSRNCSRRLSRSKASVISSSAALSALLEGESHSELFSSENNAAVAFLLSIWRYYNGLLFLILHFLHQAVPQHRVTPELRGPRRSYVDYFVRPEKNPENFTFTLMPCQLLFQERKHLH